MTESTNHPSPKEAASPGFPLLLGRFTETIDALLEMLDTVSPHVRTLDEVSREFKLPPLSEKGAAVLSEKFDGMFGEDGEDGVGPSSLDDPADVTRLVEAFREAYSDRPAGLRELSQLFLEVAVRPGRQQLLHGSILTMGVGALETAIAGVGTRHYELHPGALPSGEKEFSLAELAEFDDLRDARDFAIARRVEILMRGGFEGWRKWAGGILGDSAERLAADLTVLNEVIQRRHIVVHNGGRVSRPYKARVPESDEAIGSPLPISRDYLEEALDAIAIFGVRLILTAWSTWEPDERDVAADAANGIAFDNLVAGRNLVAKFTASAGEEIAASQDLKLYLKINEWQADRRLYGQDSIADEVRDWDTSALNPLFGVAQMALLDDFDSLATSLPELVSQKQVRPEWMFNWPLFMEFRASQQWADMQAEVANEIADTTKEPAAEDGDG